jgi:hypothetical protein
VRYTDMCAFRAIRRDALLGSECARTDLRLEHRNANARGESADCAFSKFRSIIAGAAAAAQRSPEACRGPVRAGCAHHRDFRSRCAETAAASSSRRRDLNASFQLTLIKPASPQRGLSHDAIALMVAAELCIGPAVAHPSLQ